MIINYNMNKAQSRRLQALSRANENLILYISQEISMFISDNVDTFKAVLFAGIPNVMTKAYLVNTMHLTSICYDEGILSINIDKDSATYTFISKEQEKIMCSCKGAINILPLSRISDLIKFATLKGAIPFKSNTFKYVKDLIDVCTTTENNLIISNNLVTTSSDDLKIYFKLPDEESINNIGITLQGLKEIEKFKLDCDVYSLANYIIFYRPGFVLGIRKANIKTYEIIPEMYHSDKGADINSIIDFNGFLSFLNGAAIYLTKNCKSECNLNLVNNELEVSTDIGDYIFRINRKDLKAVPQNIKNIKFSLNDLLHLKSILTKYKTDIKMLVYGNILRFQVGYTNILMRCSMR